MVTAFLYVERFALACRRIQAGHCNKGNAPYNFRYERLHTAIKQWHFNLKAANSEIVGTSKSYMTSTAQEHAIALVKTQAPSAPVQDLTYSTV